MKHVLFLLFLFVSYLMLGQQRLLNKANTLFDKFAFIEAQNIYLDMVAAGSKAPEVFAKLGDTYYVNNDLIAAHNWYKKLFENADEKDLSPTYYLRYVQTLKSVENYEAARSLLKAFKNHHGYDLLLKTTDSLALFNPLINAGGSAFQVKNIRGLNSPHADFGSKYDPYRERLVFSSNRDTFNIAQKLHSWSGQAFLDLYTVTNFESNTLTSPIKMSDGLNTSFHESSPAFTRDGKTVYFNRVSKDTPKNRDTNFTTYRLKIYKSQMQDGEWTVPVVLPFCADTYSVAHPALSPDEKKLYFVSDMPGSKRLDGNHAVAEESDIWVVDILSDDSYSVPQNLEKINTAGRETFPFVSSDNNLYFASTGYDGHGGLDIYVATADAAGQFTQVANVGKPINSPYDDFAFILMDDSKTGYFSSNRPGGVGSDDIYKLTITPNIDVPCETLITGTVMDAKTGAIVDSAQITVLDSKNQQVLKAVTSPNGTFEFALPCDSFYTIHVEKPGFASIDKTITTPTVSGNMVVSIEITNNPNAVVTCEDLKLLNGLEYIYFDFDKSNIRADTATQLHNLKTFMQLYPQSTVAITSHTDSRGSDAYNLSLSTRRAQSTRNWLVQQGIASARITARGAGEQQLVNACSNGVACSVAAHQKNRRSAFVISGLGDLNDCR